MNISRRRDEGDLSKKEKEFNNVMKEFKEKNVRELIWGNKPQEENIRVTEKGSNRELQGTHHIHKNTHAVSESRHLFYTANHTENDDEDYVNEVGNR